MKKLSSKFSNLIIVVLTSLFFFSLDASAYWYGYSGWRGWGNRGTSVYYYPGYYQQWNYNPYRYSRPYPSVTPAPTDINSCPLKPSYYDAQGNWVPATRSC